ncbi:Olfactory Receptor 2T12 [Manis pentadactyla]|nr:Olfactory Receptor 2T12 [Manis pentadactyla]
MDCFSPATAELNILTVMCFDRYAALCHPLHYKVIMNVNMCVQLTAVSWLGGGLIAIMHTAVAFTSLVVNALMILLIHQDPQLHTPMYLLLRQLSLMDRVLVCTTVPKMTAHYVTGRKSISLTGCGVQILFLRLG